MRSANCANCGKFVGFEGDLGMIHDEYHGGWEWDPVCFSCRPKPWREGAVCYCDYHHDDYHAEWCESTVGRENSMKKRTIKNPAKEDRVTMAQARQAARQTSNRETKEGTG